MFSPIALITILLLFITALFSLVWIGERAAQKGGSVTTHPLVYALTLTVYCTAWSYYGSVGMAYRSGFEFLAIYLGPTLGMLLAWVVLRKIVRISAVYRITSLADFLATRFGKSYRIGAIVALGSFFSILPYLALQLKSIIVTFSLLTHSSVDQVAESHYGVGLGLVVVMIATTITFGMRRIAISERHPGLMLLVAVAAVVKLLCIGALGIYLCYFKFDGFADLVTSGLAAGMPHPLGEGPSKPLDYSMWTTLLILSFSAIYVLPRQFHVSVVENSSEKSIATAMWFVPLYFLLQSFMVYPIASAGSVFGLSPTLADYFALTVPLHLEARILGLVVFLGGFCAAMSMIVVTTMTLSVMVGNHLLLPVIDRFACAQKIRRNLLVVRWVIASLILVASYVVYLSFAENVALEGMGVIAFAGVLQFAPALFAALFWRGANRQGAFWGMGVGFALWGVTLVIPSMAVVFEVFRPISERGFFDLEILRPTAMFVGEDLSVLSHSVFWSLIGNIATLVTISLVSEQSREELELANDFIEALNDVEQTAVGYSVKPFVEVKEKVHCARELLEEYFSIAQADSYVDKMVSKCELGERQFINIFELVELAKELERYLGSAIGSAAASKAVSQSQMISKDEAEKLARFYGEMLAELNISPHELHKKVNYYMEREALLKSHAAELKASKEFFRAVLDQIPSLISVKDPFGYYLFVNQSFARTYGIEAESVSGVDDRSLFGMEEGSRRRGIDRFVAHTRETKAWEEEVGEATTPRYLLSTASPILDASSDLWALCCVSTDITARRDLERDLEQARKMEAMGQLAGGIAHDFNNLLVGIMGYSELLAESLKDNEVLEAYAKSVLKASHRARDLVSQLLTFARQERLQKTSFDLHELIQEVIALLRHSLDPRIEICHEFCCSRCLMSGDATQVQNAILNLAVNARDAMPEGGRLVFRTSTMDPSELPLFKFDGIDSGKTYVRLQIGDSGEGIDPDIIDRIFEPFFTTKSSGKGTGLGLAAVYGTVQSHAGAIEVKSELGIGTEFTLLLPILGEVSVTDESVDLPISAKGEGCILVVDDEELVRNFTRDMLVGAGYEILLASDGQEAVDIYCKHRDEISLIILDLMMPKMNGGQALVEISKINPDAKVILASGYTFDIDRDLKPEQEKLVCGFVQKPFLLGELSNKIAKALSCSGLD